MSWEREILAATPEDLAKRNGPALLASQLQDECRKYLESVQQTADDRAALIAAMDDWHRIGELVARAHIAGRKTIRISDLIGGDQ